MSAAETKLSAGDGNGDVVALLARGLKGKCICQNKYIANELNVRQLFVGLQYDIENKNKRAINYLNMISCQMFRMFNLARKHLVSKINTLLND